MPKRQCPEMLPPPPPLCRPPGMPAGVGSRAWLAESGGGEGPSSSGPPSRCGPASLSIGECREAIRVQSWKDPPGSWARTSWTEGCQPWPRQGLDWFPWPQPCPAGQPLLRTGAQGRLGVHLSRRYWAGPLVLPGSGAVLCFAPRLARGLSSVPIPLWVCGMWPAWSSSSAKVSSSSVFRGHPWWAQD